ncbi:FKBP-type peptidyl-prolyl cis-trans isomerase [Thiomicrospira microaerophila]|uniref:FKBP-type peptidyl-prolyl cis-trans isomerase n=1 Tax=Thiomicrospira microaerophila TaxID=406020 RepID=UPI00200F010F|nr:FKBP-type peptidyl-prolyl cis-trans isomerase [Thiomicrospira microaerophila]UQB41604.1 FKBP-type peptidyl-prolyl cis-trans isomerase [Thiomicrospira microaerophila]
MSLSSKIKKSALLIGTLFISQNALANFDNLEQKASYAIGVDLANNLESQGIELDVDAFLLGLGDRLKKHELKLSEQQMAKAIQDFTQALEMKQNERYAALAKQNLERGKAFLNENKTKPGVNQLESGLQYRVVEQGTGPKATDSDVIIAHYRGRLIDGSEFDSSYNRGVPIEFKLNGVIPGWQEALKLMNAGSKWEIFVPADLAYGERGAGSVIGPNEVLIFEINFITTAVLD